MRPKILIAYGGHGGSAKDLATWRWAMDLPNLSKRELALTVPPQYTEYVGRAILNQIGA